MDLARAPRRAPLTARKKGSGYENGPKPAKVGLHRRLSDNRFNRRFEHTTYCVVEMLKLNRQFVRLRPPWRGNLG